MNTAARASATELLIVWTVVLTACLGFWVIVAMAVIRALDTLSVISW